MFLKYFLFVAIPNTIEYDFMCGRKHVYTVYCKFLAESNGKKSKIGQRTPELYTEIERHVF